jgi:uncharacterized protein YraI
MQGTTTTRVNLRRGPGTDQPVLRVLDPGTPVTFDAVDGDWLQVQAAGQSGFVSSHFVAQEQQSVPAGFVGVPGSDPLPGIELAPDPAEQIQVGPNATSVERTVASTWNHSGNVLNALATHMKFAAGCAVAVFGTESSGNAFGAGGRMTIRFENHHFFQFWGKANPDEFRAHFQFDAVKPWTGHQWRAAADGAFQPVHVNQSSEWSAFQFAGTLDATAARLSISMGGPQILGSNFAEAGFESVEQMFDAFTSSEKRQIVAFFDFLQGTSTHPPKVIALQQRDFVRFAELYNGPANAAEYSARIASCFEAFERLRPNT